MLNNPTFRLVIALLVAAVFWTFIVYKAISIPITHDEVPGPTHYCNFSVWKIMMYPDASPNNHILNTLFTKLSMFLFGNGQLAVRLPNILFFGVYFYAAYQISKTLFSKDNLLFFGCLAAFLCNPFLIDFFSLCRGYGISNALMLCSVLFCLQAYLYQKEKLIWWSLLFSLLASYANFTLLVFWSAINIMTFLFFITQYYKTKQLPILLRQTGLLALSAIAYAALIYTPIQKMQSTNQFDPWQSNGFFQDTMVSLIENTLYGSKMINTPTKYLAFLVIMIVMVAGAVFMYSWGKHYWQKVSKTPLFIAFAILSLTAFVNILQTIILKTPNLTGRTALCFYPLFVFLITSIIYHVSNRSLLFTKVWSVAVIILGIIHLDRTVSWDRVREWWYDVNTLQVLKIIQTEANQKNAPIHLKTNWVFYPSFDFYLLTGKSPYLKLGAYDKGIDTINRYDYYYIFDSDYPLLQNQYEIVEKYDGGGRMLLKRKE